MKFGVDTGKDDSLMSTFTIRSDGSITFGQNLLEITRLPKQYIFNGNTTILIHDDKTKTIVRTMEGDNFDPVLGFLTAYFQKHSGLSKHKANEYLTEVRKKYDESVGVSKCKANEYYDVVVIERDDYIPKGAKGKRLQFDSSVPYVDLDKHYNGTYDLTYDGVDYHNVYAIYDYKLEKIEREENK